MYYYIVDGNEILKYEVSFDLEKVKELQKNYLEIVVSKELEVIYVMEFLDVIL